MFVVCVVVCRCGYVWRPEVNLRCCPQDIHLLCGDRVSSLIKLGWLASSPWLEPTPSSLGVCVCVYLCIHACICEGFVVALIF